MRENAPESLIKSSLFKRIDWLKENRDLTEQLADWAHTIRLEGNDAAHEEEPETENDARQLQKFTEVFLQYVFTLPGELNVQRNKTTTNKQTTTDQAA